MTKTPKNFLNWKICFFIALCIVTIFASITSLILVHRQNFLITKVDKKVENYIVSSKENNKEILKSNAYIEFCETINSRADAALNEVITIVGIFASIITLLGVFITFKAPKDFEKDIKELRELTDRTNNIVEEQEYLLLIFNAIKEKTIYHRVKALTSIVNQYPNRWQAFLYRGREYDKNREYNKAISDYRRARTLGCNSESYFNNMSISLSNRYKISKNKTDQEQALKFITQAININPETPMYYNNRGLIYIEMNNYDDAEKDLDIAISIDPENYEAFSGKASLYLEKSKTTENRKLSDEYKEKAISFIRTAIDLNSEDIFNLELLNQLLRDESLIETTEDSIKELIETPTEDTSRTLLNNYENVVEDLAFEINEKLGDITYEEENYIYAITNYTNALVKYNTTTPDIILEKIDIIDRICNKIYNCKSKMPSIDISDSINRKLYLLIVIIDQLAFKYYNEKEYLKAGKFYEYTTTLGGFGTSSSNNLAYMIRRNEYSCNIYNVQDLLGCRTPDESSAFLRINRALCILSGIEFEFNLSTALKEIKLCGDELPAAIKWWANDDKVGHEESNLVILLLSVMKKIDIEEYGRSIKDMLTQAIADGFNLPENIEEIANEILTDETK